MCAVLAAAWLVGMASALASRADEFRFDNEVFVGGEAEPEARTTTIFLDRLVYDFLEKPAEVTVFDKAAGRFTLLDLTRRVRTEVSAKQVTALTERLQAWARVQTDPLLQFLAAPSFEEVFDAQTGRLALSSELVTYEVSAVSASSEAVSRQYREFSDWHCRLNTAIRPGAWPPLSRLMVNAALDARGLLPREVVRTHRSKPGFLAKKFTVRSEHRVFQQLAESDRQRIAQIDQFLALFVPVSFEEYQAGIGG